MATITNVADLVLWDANYRVLRLATLTSYEYATRRLLEFHGRD